MKTALAATLAATLAACASPKQTLSERFWDFWADTANVFRGLAPRENFDGVYGRETAVPRYDDQLGVQFHRRPATGVELFVEYHKDSANLIRAINAEMIFADETEARNLHRECRIHLTQKYRRPEKNDDRLVWKTARGTMTLRLVAPKKTVVFSAVAQN